MRNSGIFLTLTVTILPQLIFRGQDHSGGSLTVRYGILCQLYRTKISLKFWAFNKM
jgi:hypothetical protein